MISCSQKVVWRDCIAADPSESLLYRNTCLHIFPPFNTLTYLFVPIGGEVLVHELSILMSLLPEFSLGGLVHVRAT